MGLYFSRLKAREEETAEQRPIVRTATNDPLISRADVDVSMQGEDYWKTREAEVRPQLSRFAGQVPPKKEEQGFSRDNLKERGSVAYEDPYSGQKKYFIDNAIRTPIRNKSWDEMTPMQKFIASGQEAESVGKNLAGTAVLGPIASMYAAAGATGRAIESITTFGQIQKIQDKFGIDKTASQHLMDLSNVVSEYKNKEFGTATYKPEDITVKNIPKLLLNPEFVLNSLTSLTSTGLIASMGGLPALTMVEGGGLLTEKRAEALLKGDKATTNGEILYSAGMGLFNAWLENFSLKVMTGAGKIPVADALIGKISNNLIRGITNWGAKVSVEMGEEYIQEALPLLVSEAIFKEKGDVRSMFQRVVDKMPEAKRQGTIGAIMALPGAGILSGMGVAVDNRIQQQQQQEQKIQKAKQEQEAGTAKAIFESSKFVAGKDGVAGLKLDLTDPDQKAMVIDDKGNVTEKAQKGRVDDIAQKLAANFDEQTSENFRAEMEGQKFKSLEEADSKMRKSIFEVIPEGSKELFIKSKETYGELKERGIGIKTLSDIKPEAAVVKGEAKIKAEVKPLKGTGTVRIKDTIPTESLKNLYIEAEKVKVSNTLGKAMSKTLSEEEIGKLNDTQKAVLTIGLESMVASDEITEGPAVANIQALGGTVPTQAVVAAEAPITKAVEVAQKIEVKPTKAEIEPIVSVKALREADKLAVSKISPETEALRDEARQEVFSNLTKKADTFVNVTGGKNKAPAFSLSVKKLPNLKYGYAITMNTPKASKVVQYAPKFSSKEKAMRMGIQGAVRMVQSARQAGVPVAGLNKIKTALMRANKKLGKEALPAEKVKKVVKETKKRIEIAKKLRKVKKAVYKAPKKAKGPTPISKFEKVPKAKKEVQTVTKGFKLHEKSLELIRKYATRIGEGKLPRGTAGVFKEMTKTIRTRSLTEISVIAHEIAHHLDLADTQMSEKFLRNDSGLQGSLDSLYIEYYPGAKLTHTRRLRTVEGFATLLQKYAEMPLTIEVKYPELINAFFKEGGEFYSPLFSDIIKDLRKIIGDYQGLSVLDKISARQTNEELKVDKKIMGIGDKVKTFMSDFIYPIEALAKKVKTHFTEKDLSLWMRMYDTTLPTILSNNILGKSAFVKGYSRLVTDISITEIKQTLPYNWADLVNEVDTNYDSFGAFLIARRKFYEFKEFSSLKIINTQLKREALHLGLEENVLENKIKRARKKSKKKELKEELASVKSSFRDVNKTLSQNEKDFEALGKIIENDQISEKEATEAYNEGKNLFMKATKRFDALVAEDLKFANDPAVQLIKDEEYKKLVSNEGYAPFKRAFYDEIIGSADQVPRHMMIGKNKISSLARRTGSSRVIINPLAGAIWNHAEFTKKGLRQIVYNKAVDYSTLAPDVIERVPLKSYVDENSGAVMFPQEKDQSIIMARVNYKRVPLLVDSTIKQVFDSVLTHESIDDFGKIMTSTSRLFAKGTTGLYAQFLLPNVLLDQISAAGQSNHLYIPFYTAAKTLHKTLSERDSLEAKFAMEYLRLGGERQTAAGWLNQSPEELRKTIQAEKKGLEKITKWVDRFGDVLGVPATYSEMGTRMVEYIMARKAFDSQVVALERAGRVSAPFHHKGAWFGSFSQTWIKAIPFFNPSIQVVAQAAETLNTPKGRRKYLTVVAAVSAAQIAALGLVLSGGSDEQKRKYIGIHANQLADYIFLPNPANKKELIKIRIPSQFSSISVAINMIIGNKFMKAGYNFKEFYEGSSSFLPDQLNPGNFLSKQGWAKLVAGWLPQLLKIPVQLMTGKRVFPEVMPMEGYSLTKKLPSERYVDSTSEGAKLLGKLLNFSPVKIDFALTGIFGRYIGYLTLKPSAYDLRKSYIQTEYFNSSRQIKKYFDIKEKNDQKYSTYKGDKTKKAEFRAATKKRVELKKVADLLTKLKKVDENKFSNKAEAMRQKIFSLINKL